MVLAQLLISGILIGGVYALVSLGLTLIFGVMRIVNFAHGDLLMLAMYLAFWGTTLMGVPPYVSLFVIAPLLALLGAAVYWLVIRPAVRKSHEASILATIGLSIIIQNAALMAWSADYRSLHSDFTGAVLEWGALRISVPLLTAFLVALAVTGLVFLFLHFTYAGKAIRAAAAERYAAVLMGVNPQRLFTLCFAIGSALVGVGGVLLAPIYSVYPTVGEQFLLVAFVVVVLGGLGSLKGAVVGGLVIGLVETLSSYFIAPSMKQLVYLLMFIAILILKPGGLFGKRMEGVGVDE